MAYLINTVFNYPEWTQADGLSDAVVSGAVDGIAGNGGWTATPGAVEDRFTGAAAMPGAGSARGFRHAVGDGLNNVGGGITIDWSSQPRTELWLQWYARFPVGFTWGS